MVLAAQGASASIAPFHTGGLNASVTVDHVIERAAAATSHNPVVNQQGLIGLGHFIESRYGVKLGDILFYNGKQTTNASLASPRGDIYGAAVVDPSSAQYGTIYLDTTAKGLSTRTLAATLGHETAHLDYAPGKGYLVFRDSSHTQEGLSDLAGKALTQALDVTHPGIWDTGHTAAWQQGLVDSPYTRIGTQYANAVGNARVKYRQLNTGEIRLSNEYGKAVQQYAARQGVAITEEQGKARIQRQILRFVDAKANKHDGGKLDELVVSVIGMKGHDATTGTTWDYSNYAKKHPGAYNDPTLNTKNTALYSPALANTDFGLTPQQREQRASDGKKLVVKTATCLFTVVGCAFVSGYTVGEGVKDISAGHVGRGSLQIGFGALGLAGTAYAPVKAMVEARQGGAALVSGEVRAFEQSSGVTKGTVRANKAAGDAFEAQVKGQLQRTQTGVVEQVTVKTQSGVRTRIDLLGRDAGGAIRCTECKASATAPLTKNQRLGFPEIQQSGGVVVGKGKPGFPGGTQIPPTKVDIIRP